MLRVPQLTESQIHRADSPALLWDAQGGGRRLRWPWRPAHVTKQCADIARNNSSFPSPLFALITEPPLLLSPTSCLITPLPWLDFHTAMAALLLTASPDPESAGVTARSALPHRRLFLELHSSHQHPGAQPFLHPHRKQPPAPTLCQVLYLALRI